MAAPEEALSAKNVTYTGYEGAEINAYQALPAGDGPFPGVFVIHHLPGWDSGTKEITRRFAASGYNAICPNLYARQGLDVDPDDAAAATREAGGIPDDQFVGDAKAAIEALRALPTSNGKVGVIGYCSGGRHSFLTAVSLPVDAAVDCYGAFVVGTPPDGFPLKVTPLVDRTPELSCPLLGLFGNEDQFPNPEQVDELEAALKAAGKNYEFHRYDDAGHAFFSVDRTAYRPEAAVDGWQRIFEFYGQHLGADHVLLPHRQHRDRRQRQGRPGLVQRQVGQRLLRPSLPRALRPHAQHRLRRPVPRPGARVAVELSAESARRLIASIEEALAAAGAAAS